MKSIILLVLCAATVFGQTAGPRPAPPPPPCVPNASTGVTQTMCDNLRKCMEVAYPKPAPGAPPPSATDANRDAKRQYETNCATQYGIPAAALESIRAQRGPPPQGPPPTRTTISG